MSRFLLTTLLLLALIMLNLACDEKKRPVDPGQMERRTALRQQLKQELGARYDDPVPPATQAQLERGRQLYPQLCAACHGPRGNGEGHTGTALQTPPTSFTDPKQATFFSEQARLHIIRKGIPGTPMMAWESVLPEKDVLAIYVYIRSLME